ncbi:YjjW family glycine radical enzyme activase [Pseudovibrio exalbescens]|uniref:YjjW family glycine radical enzyme activase n=1 Tax=Pseudovibrio exalbescens TaxID=197461 RepID=UPI0023652441|nr:YjjW family glycine radical enzyme activase [Pseudovibrio exalbescens]MDD7910516.1 YjjW family glycine radical enzyme activase [Pseudovibrio exalbescens]
MNLPEAKVSKILNFSCVDGPGNRLVLFLQGCNFACLNCHNPHTMALCNHCGDCVPACPTGALSMIGGRVVHDPTRCDECDQCLEVCPINSNPKVFQVTIGEVLELVQRNKPFLNGITVSGGEATTQLKFITALFGVMKQSVSLRDLTCFIDSNGYLPEFAWRSVLPYTDGVMLDIKSFDCDLHCKLTGRTNERVLASARFLHAEGKLHELRYLLIPGMTDVPAEIDRLLDFVLDLSPGLNLRLNAFQHHGVRGEAQDWPAAEKDRVEEIASQLRRGGLSNVTTPAVYI